MSKKFEMVKDYYERGLWNLYRVHTVTGKKLGITTDEYRLITGRDYTATLTGKEVS